MQTAQKELAKMLLVMACDDLLNNRAPSGCRWQTWTHIYPAVVCLARKIVKLTNITYCYHLKLYLSLMRPNWLTSCCLTVNDRALSNVGLTIGAKLSCDKSPIVKFVIDEWVRSVTEVSTLVLSPIVELVTKRPIGKHPSIIVLATWF